ncbi:MAG: homoserine dehydrogenase [Candidatus Marinimicrobia bacterium]|nr:homoserine dehydrogenase [Candidatus Neomarinimicrobiota bacterium]
MQSIKVGLLGFGTIGTGVVKVFQQNQDLLASRLGTSLELVRIADLDTTTDRGVQLAPGLLTDDAQALLNDPEIKVVIELIGGYEPARTFVLQAIRNGKHIVTANKALLAMHGEEIFRAAEEAGVTVMFEAAVGGGIPVISAIKENLGANNFSALYGILNGTCNYILTQMDEEGKAFADVLADAQKQGYAEADPTFDVEGVDTAHKLALLISLCFGTRVNFDQIYTEGISKVTALDIEFAHGFGYKLKLLAIGKRDGEMIEARVHPTMIPKDYPLSSISGVFNSVRLVGDFSGPVMLSGYGAGMDATASAIMGDVLAVARDLQGNIGLRSPALGCPQAQMTSCEIKPMDQIVSAYYLRFMVKDQPGVLAQIAGILGSHEISIESMVQPHRHAAEAVPIVFMTHEAEERNVAAALAEIDQLDTIQEDTLLIRIEENLE